MTPSRARDLLLFWAGGGEVAREDRPEVAERYLRLEIELERLQAEIGEREREAAERWAG